MTGRDASGVYGIQMFSVRREQGRLAELAPVIQVLASGKHELGAWRPGLAATLAELGLDEDVRRELDVIAREGLAPLRESLWLASLTYLADACAAVGDERMAAFLYPELEPHAGTNVMVGYGVACYGSADRYLGMLAATLGDRELAEGHFEKAMELNRGMGATTWVAHTAYEHGRLLLASPGGDRNRAAALLGEAAALGEQIGMPSLLDRIRRLDAMPPRPTLPDDLSAREAQILRQVARGLSNKEIGKELFISEHTAANHIRSILRKTGCANRTEAATYAHRHGLVEA
jgi:DNA-binding CsgD family transcriptional regulator